MKKYLDRLPQEIRDIISLASNTASQENTPIYLVGGFVRDLILGVKNLDLDIVAEGDGIKFAEAMAAKLKARLVRHRRFGTATIILSHRLKIDIATARSECYPQPACLPEVTRGSLKLDLGRRDFSINAMAIDINAGNFGVPIDFFDGKNDLQAKKIRILHKLSFIDDPTRILRAIRFEKRYDFKIEPRTLACLRDAVRLGMLEKVQPQRVRDELILVLREAQPLKAIKRIDSLVGFSFISPGLELSPRTYKLLGSIFSQIKWFERVYHYRRPPDAWLLYFMGLADPLNLKQARLVCLRFAFRKGEEKRIIDYKQSERKRASSLSRPGIKPARIFALLEPLSYEAILLLKAKYKNRNIQAHINDFLEIYNGMRTLISGHDLKGLGISPGPQYQKIFAGVLEAKLNGLVKTKEEELAMIRRLADF